MPYVWLRESATVVPSQDSSRRGPSLIKMPGRPQSKVHPLQSVIRPIRRFLPLALLDCYINAFAFESVVSPIPHFTSSLDHPPPRSKTRPPSSSLPLTNSSKQHPLQWDGEATTKASAYRYMQNPSSQFTRLHTKSATLQTTSHRTNTTSTHLSKCRSQS